MPSDTGQDFWLALSRTRPPLVNRKMGEKVYQCPYRDMDGEWGSCDYRGPAKNVDGYDWGDPVGADLVNNHGVGDGGNVIRKSGHVETVSVNNELWMLASVKTSVNSAKDKDRIAALEKQVADLEKKAKELECALANQDKVRICRDMLDELSMACKAYHFDFTFYPPTGNKNMIQRLAAKGPRNMEYYDVKGNVIIKQGELMDPWGSQVIYINNTDNTAPKGWVPHNTKAVDIYSYGPNGKDDKGGGDDINNWE
jgi:hypothetical protein